MLIQNKNRQEAESQIKLDKFGRPIADNHALRIADYLASNKEEAQKLKSIRSETPWYRLIIKAIGSPLVVLNKTGRFLKTLFNYIYVPNQRRRLQRLKEIGFIERIPSQAQLWAGAIDMLRFFIKPGAESYIKAQGLNFTFHQVLRILNDPAAMIDPIGIRVPRDAIIGHLLEVVHANPVYDFQLLQQFDDGLDQLELQTRQMIEKSHPRYESISAITEDADYHQRLLSYLLAYRENPLTRQMIRDTGSVRSDKYFILAEATFGTLPSVFRYINRLPSGLFSLLRHIIKSRHIQTRFCDAYIVEDFENVFNMQSMPGAA